MNANTEGERRLTDRTRFAVQPLDEHTKRYFDMFPNCRKLEWSMYTGGDPENTYALYEVRPQDLLTILFRVDVYYDLFSRTYTDECWVLRRRKLRGTCELLNEQYAYLVATEHSEKFTCYPGREPWSPTWTSHEETLTRLAEREGTPEPPVRLPEQKRKDEPSYLLVSVDEATIDRLEGYASALPSINNGGPPVGVFTLTQQELRCIMLLLAFEPWMRFALYRQEEERRVLTGVFGPEPDDLTNVVPLFGTSTRT